MRRIRLSWLIFGLTCVVAGAVAAFFTRSHWQPWFAPSAASEEPEDKHAAPIAEANLLQLTRQARDNLGIVAEPAMVETYWRKVQIPGVIVDRPGASDRVVAAPTAGVVIKMHALPGDSVEPGQTLFTLRLIGEPVLTVQAELTKNEQEIPIIQKQMDNAMELSKTGAVPALRVVELETQLQRLKIAAGAARQQLLALGMKEDQIERIAKGAFETTINIAAPALAGIKPGKAGAEPFTRLEVQQLKVELGQQVAAGQSLCILGDHTSLYIEGHGFRRDAPLLEKAAEHGWAVEVELTEDPIKDEDGAKKWPPLSTFTIKHVANTVDPVTRTFAFYLPLTNQRRSYKKDGRMVDVWRFRPGQHVRLHVPVEEMKNVIKVPADAVVREGPEAYVFTQNGDLFERRPVHVLHEDRLYVVLANDGSVREDVDFVAQSGAATLNRVLKAQASSGGLPPGAHFHADGTLHIPGK